MRARPQRTEVECVDGGMEKGRCGVRGGRRKVWAAVEMGEATLDRQVTGWAVELGDVLVLVLVRLRPCVCSCGRLHAKAAGGHRQA